MTTYMLDDVTGRAPRRHHRRPRRRHQAVRRARARSTRCGRRRTPATLAADVLPLVTQAVMVRNTTKHVQDEVRTPEMVEPILEIYEAACGASLTERPCFSVTNCTIAPLQHDREMTEAGLKLVHRGVPIFVLPMPQAGTTGPMTLLGTCILNMAELLSGIVLYQLAHPGCALISGVGSAVADMRSGGYIASSPEIGLINLICLEMSRFYGLPTQATGMSADAKAANFQAGLGGRHDGAHRRPRRRRLAHLRRRARRRADLEPREVRARQRPDRRAAPLPARGRASTRRPRSWTTSSRSASAGTSSGARARARSRAARSGARRCSSAARSRSSPGGRSRTRPPPGRARSSRRTRSPPLPEDADRHIDDVIAGWAARAGLSA